MKPADIIKKTFPEGSPGYLNLKKFNYVTEEVYCCVWNETMLGIFRNGGRNRDILLNVIDKEFEIEWYA